MMHVWQEKYWLSICSSPMARLCLQYNEPKKLYLALLGILQRSGRSELCNTTLKTMTKKFGGSCKVWVRAMEHALTTGRWWLEGTGRDGGWCVVEWSGGVHVGSVRSPWVGGLKGVAWWLQEVVVCVVCIFARNNRKIVHKA